TRPSSSQPPSASASISAQRAALSANPVRKSGASLEQINYPCSGHLFADPDLPAYDAAAFEVMWEIAHNQNFTAHSRIVTRVSDRRIAIPERFTFP
ncbi:MAG: dienelactone hydrolase family protein, partial [Acidobacteriia bacterium]|nr:dienelactone hydrolase family protein [Terriglobia bacterium]